MKIIQAVIWDTDNYICIASAVMGRIVVRLEGMAQLKAVLLRAAAVATTESTSESISSVLGISKLNLTEVCYK